jgi:UDP-N-acetylglucosamine 2-epimerase
MPAVAVIAGTRPEAVKMAPVIQALSRSTFLHPVVISTSQHREMVGQVLRSFDIRIDHDLKVMRNGQNSFGRGHHLPGSSQSLRSRRHAAGIKTASQRRFV